LIVNIHKNKKMEKPQNYFYGFFSLTCYIAREAGVRISFKKMGRRRLVIKKAVQLLKFVILCCSLVIFSAISNAAGKNTQRSEQKYQIDIPQSDAVLALNRLAEQTDTVMLFSYNDTKTRQTNRVKGYYTLMQAIDILLEGSGLSSDLSTNGVIKFTVVDSARRNNNTEERPSVQKSKKGMLASLIALISSTGTTVSYAQNDPASLMLEEVVVTATKRKSTIQDLPFSINAQSQKDIERSGATNLEELSRNVAGLAIQNLGPGQSQVAIRGVSAGQIVRDQAGVKEQVGVYMDESVISLSLFTPDLDLYDLNRVETLRGPQGTLFGSGSMGGTIRYITNQPNLEEFEASTEASLSSVTDGEEGGHIKGMVNIPLSDSVAIRAVGYSTAYAGFIDAYREGGSKDEDVNGGDRIGARIALTWQPNDSLTITPRIIKQDIEVDGFNRQEVFNVLANPYTTTRPAITFDDREQFLVLDEGFEDDLMIADLTAELELDSFDITFVSSYTERDILATRDATSLTGSVSIDFGFDESDVTIPSKLLDATGVEQTTFELRFASNSDSALQWIVGTFYSNTDREYSQTLPTPGYDAALDARAEVLANDGDPLTNLPFSADVANGFGPDSPYASALAYDLEQIALFGEASYEVTDRLVVTLGGRFYDYEEEREFSSGGVFATGVTSADNISSDGFNPRLLASYELSDTVTLNAQAAQGFRLGGINDPLNANLCTADDLVTYGPFQLYDDETMWNYELGFKARTGRWSFNAATFYADISDLQVNLDAGECSSRVSVNVEEAHTMGVEAEFTSQLTDQLYVSFSGSYTEAEFDSDLRDQDGGIIGGIQKGNRLASVPELQFAVASTYTLPFVVLGSSNAYISASVQYIGDRYTQPGDQISGAGNFVSNLPYAGATGSELTSLDLELDAYQTVNISGGLVYDSWEAIFFANNVTDENANLSFDKERNGRARLGFQTNQPRTIGVTVRKEF
jgi:iron complex outermembrane recepter protein